MLQDLWTPTGAAYKGAVPVGYNVETGSGIVVHTVMLKAKDKFGKEHKMQVQVLADRDTSQAQVEDMMGGAAERFLRDVREKYDKRPATAEEMKEAGKALNDFLQHRTRRRNSTSNKLYF